MSRIGVQRSVTSIRAAIREPSADIARGYRGVEIRERDGGVIRGVLLNQDAQSVQVLDIGESLQSYRRDQVGSIETLDASLMPELASAVTEDQMEDLVTYLAALTGETTVASASTVAGVPPAAPTFQRILDAGEHPDEWVTFGGDYRSHRFSGLTDIDPGSVGGLELKWVYSIASRDKIEATPLVSNGVMYVTGPGGSVHAIDVDTGRAYWRYEPSVAPDLPLCCGRPNRGAALLDGAIYVGRLDGRLVSLDAITGSVLWEAQVAEPAQGYTITVAPLAVRDMILIGVSGGEYGVRGFIDAYDASTGERRWRFHTIPGPGEPGNETWSGDSWRVGGGPTWMTGSYDPELDLVYWGVGNPGPPLLGEVRPGDNLYTNSVVALDVASGALRWAYQFTPHDTHDWDANQAPVLHDAEIDGRTRRLMLWANRNGFYYVLDRETGEFISATAFAEQDWAEGFDAQGRPIVRESSITDSDGATAAPGEGATNWYPPAFDAEAERFFVLSFDSRAVNYSAAEAADVVPGRFFMGSYGLLVPVGDVRVSVRALDGLTGRVVWESPIEMNVGATRLEQEVLPASSGLLATAGGLVFGGTTQGHFFALEAGSGRKVWSANLGGAIHAPPISFQHAGDQMITVAAGNSFYAFGLRRTE